MDNLEFVEDFADILETDVSELNESSSLEPENWESLTIVSLISLIDQHYGVTLDVDDFSDCTTMAELLDKVKSRRIH